MRSSCSRIPDLTKHPFEFRLLNVPSVVPLAIVFALAGIYVAIQDALEGAIPADNGVQPIAWDSLWIDGNNKRRRRSGRERSGGHLVDSRLAGRGFRLCRGADAWWNLARHQKLASKLTSWSSYWVP